MTFEEQFKQLETIVTKLEAGELSLDESLAEYEQGIKTLRSCREILDKAELRIEELAPPNVGAGFTPARARSSPGAGGGKPLNYDGNNSEAEGS